MLPCSLQAQSEADERNAISRAFQLADAQLNDVYKKLMPLLEEKEKIKMKNDQREWLKNRDKVADRAAAEFKDSNYFTRTREETMIPLTVDRYAILLKHYYALYVYVVMAEDE
jgi:uncharacterized protein YecT (DUF1311 family)